MKGYPNADRLWVPKCRSLRAQKPWCTDALAYVFNACHWCAETLPDALMHWCTDALIVGSQGSLHRVFAHFAGSLLAHLAHYSVFLLFCCRHGCLLIGWGCKRHRWHTMAHYTVFFNILMAHCWHTWLTTRCFVCFVVVIATVAYSCHLLLQSCSDHLLILSINCVIIQLLPHGISNKRPVNDK